MGGRDASSWLRERSVSSAGHTVRPQQGGPPTSSAHARAHEGTRADWVRNLAHPSTPNDVRALQKPIDSPVQQKPVHTLTLQAIGEGGRGGGARSHVLWYMKVSHTHILACASHAQHPIPQFLLPPPRFMQTPHPPPSSYSLVRFP